MNLTEANDSFPELLSKACFSSGNLRNLETLKVLLQIYPDFKGSNYYGMNYLHVAAYKGAVDWIKYLVKVGHSVHEKDDHGETPMFHFNAYDTNYVGIIQVLVKNGANIYAVNLHQENIAHLLLRRMSLNLQCLPQFLKYTLNRGYHQLWAMKDDKGTSAYQLLSGETSPSAKVLLSKLSSSSSRSQS